MQLIKAIFVFGSALVVAVGSQIQAKHVVNQLNAPLLIACIVSIFLAIFGVAQWSCGTRNNDLKKQSVSRLVLIVLHFSDIMILFIALKYSSVSIIALMQLAVVNLWQLFYAPNDRSTRRFISMLIFSFGIFSFLWNQLLADQLARSVLEIISAIIYALVNHYLHHYAQRWVDPSQFVQSEILASCSIAVSMAPFAWLELNTIDLKDSEASSLITSIVIMCILVLVYRRSGSVFNSLSYSGTAKFIIASTVLVVAIIDIDNTSPLLVFSGALMAVSAYLSSLDPPQEGGSESRVKLNLLLALCAVLVLFHCSMVLATQETGPELFIQFTMTNETRGLPPLPADPVREFNRLVCLRKARDRVINDVSPIFTNGRPYVYMDLPIHWNLGDTLIWQGTEHLLEIRGQFPLLTDRSMERNINNAKAILGNGTALLHGGGNFGDLWRDPANFRNKVVTQFIKNDIIFLPQSLHYTNASYANMDNKIFQTNNRTLFMFRDYPSLQFSQENFPGKRAIYVPDMALMMGPQAPNANPVVDIILLLRLDKEKVVKDTEKKDALEMLKSANVSFEVWDFPIYGFPMRLLKDNKTVIYNYTTIYPKQLASLSLKTDNRHAFMGINTQMANNVFSRGRMVITDRLHASIMTTLMGKPLIYLDNSYKKIMNVRSAMARAFTECTDENLRARHTSSMTEAAKLAIQIIGGSVKL